MRQDDKSALHGHGIRLTMTSSMYQPLDDYFIYNLVKYKSIRRFKMMSLDPTDSNKRIVHPVKSSDGVRRVWK